MKRSRSLRERIKRGELNRQDVLRLLGELAYGRVNDCVKLVLQEQEDPGQLDLSLLTEVKRNEKGTVEVKLVDRLQVLKLLAELAGEENGSMEVFLKAVQGDEG